jgi:hypothetical protein
MTGSQAMFSGPVVSGALPCVCPAGQDLRSAYARLPYLG